MLQSVPPVPNRTGVTPPSQRVASPAEPCACASRISRASQINSLNSLRGFDGSVPVPAFLIVTRLALYPCQRRSRGVERSGS